LSETALEESKGDDEDAACGNGHQDDRVAIRSLSSRGSGCGVIPALGASLGVKRWRENSEKKQG
jgi:hypothetical protein